MKKLNVVTRILDANDRIAEENRSLLRSHGILCINLMASAGAGKTSLILKTNQALRGRLRLGVIEGDLASKIDADKVASHHIPVVQINTGRECHLDATMIEKALKALPLSEIDLLFIENVGNLICPVEFQLGEEIRVMIASVAEGDDKPYKYPGIFTAVNAVVVNKMDLCPYVDFGLQDLCEGIRLLNREAGLFPVSCKTGEGLLEWADWLEKQWEKKLQLGTPVAIADHLRLESRLGANG
jgi:hydrogenase nickel incorporation protein HypB